jgi:predicted DNA-binding protein (MmcQ/YjbR family)
VTPEAFDAACLSLPAATVNVQWGSDRVYKVGEKMFAVLGPDGSCSFKANDIAFEMLTTEGPAKPAPYMARARWVWLAQPDALPDEEMRAYLSEAHRLVAAKLTRKARTELGLK